MKITWLGHSCFKIESKDYSIVTDPYSNEYVPGFGDLNEKANFVFSSHGHADHAAVDLIEIIHSFDSPFDIKYINTFHDEVYGAKRGINRIAIFDDGKYKAAHCGDLGCVLEPEQEEMLTELDVLMVPVGGFYTIGPKEATELIHRINPRYVIPMHFKSIEYGFGFDVISDIHEFADLNEDVYFSDSSVFDLEGDNHRITVLMPKYLKTR